ncbi:MAG: hypothetical protein KME55_24490 [Nostoc indistinguendum CM1-VF10]|jgi:hypothetical protein|nr:hypothetical protein [Nostoc indistinguendum CM1-VF10]
MGQDAVRRSRILRSLKYNNIVISRVEQPGITTNFVKGDTYLLMSRTNGSTLPVDTNVYDSIIFRSLLKTRLDPEALLVKAVSIDKQNKQAIVSSDCAPKPFAVSLKNLYEEYQTLTDDSGYSRTDISF